MKSHDPETLVEPVVFWMWNETPSPDEIRTRLDHFLAHGIRAINLHSMPDNFRHAEFHGGMRVPYLSEEFFQLVEVACHEIKKRGMTLWLYDEGGWPSGSAGGAVVSENPDFGLWALARQDDDFRPHQFLSEHCYPDLMNAGATHSFLRLTHEQYKAHIGCEFGKTVKGIFTDEPRIMGRVGSDVVPWSPQLPAAFAAHHGYELHTILPLLFENAKQSRLYEQEKVTRAQRDYLHSVSTLIAENYYSVIAQWCKRNKLLFEGHHSGEDEWSRHGQYFGDFLQQARHYDIPGTDTIWRQIFPGQSGGNYVGLASSSSWLRNQRVALTECGAVYGAGVTLEELRWIAGYHLVRGVNKMMFMAAAQSDVGQRRIGLCGIDFSAGSPLWPHADLLFNYVRRGAQFSVSGEAKPRIGIFYRSELVDSDAAQQFNDEREALCERLHDAMAGLLFLGLEDLQNAAVRDGAIHCGKLKLSLLVLHVSTALGCSERKVIQGLASQGAPILFYGEATKLSLICKAEHSAKRSVHYADDLDSEVLQNKLAEISVFELKDDVRGVRVLPLEDGDQQKLLLFNQNLHAVSFEFRLKSGQDLAEVALENSAAIDGSLIRRFHGRYCIALQPGELRALETTDAPRLRNSHFEGLQPQLLREYVLEDWNVQEEASYVINEAIERETLTDTNQTMPLGDYNKQHPDFSGTLLYETLFSSDLDSGVRVLLDLGKVFYCASVRLNGHDCGRRAWSPFIFDITSFVIPGENTLQVSITNTMANQWARSDIRRRDFELSGNMYLEKCSSFIDESCHAGLVGPVVVRSYSTCSNAATEREAAMAVA